MERLMWNRDEKGCKGCAEGGVMLGSGGNSGKSWGPGGDPESAECGKGLGDVEVGPGVG